MKKNIRIMYAVSLLQGMVFYGPIATLYRQARGVSVFEITLIESISLALCLVLEIPWGFVADRIGYKRTMTFCCGLYFVSKVVFWQAEDFWGFLAERILLSVVMAGLSGVDESILYLSCKKEDSQRVFGLYNGLGTAGLLIASAVFSLFIGGNDRLAGGLTVVSYGLAALLSLLLVEVKGESRAMSLAQLKVLLLGALRGKTLLLLLAASAFLSEANQTITVFLGQVKYASCGLSAPAMGYVYAAVTLIGLCGVLSSRLSAAVGRIRLSMLLYGAAAAACLLMAFSSSAVVSIAAVLTLRLTASLFQPLTLTLQNELIATPHRATALSINAMIMDSVGVGTNLLFGALSDVSLRSSLLFGAALYLTGGGLLLGFFRAGKRSLAAG
jgi:MFS family permease